MWLAEMESRSFSWKGIGKTKKAAIQALIEGWNRLVPEYEGAMLTFEEYAQSFGCTVKEFISSDINVIELVNGQAYRDNEKI